MLFTPLFTALDTGIRFTYHVYMTRLEPQGELDISIYANMISILEAIETELKKEGFTIFNPDGTYNLKASAEIARTIMKVRTRK